MRHSNLSHLVTTTVSWAQAWVRGVISHLILGHSSPVRIHTRLTLFGYQQQTIRNASRSQKCMGHTRIPGYNCFIGCSRHYSRHPTALSQLHSQSASTRRSIEACLPFDMLPSHLPWYVNLMEMGPCCRVKQDI
jgi:hypothetical protein